MNNRNNNSLSQVQSSDNYVVAGGGAKFDILKLLLAVMVVMIHTKPLPDFFMPLLRMSIPLFFIMSSYFYFLKQKEQSFLKKRENLKKYVLRILRLYLFWFVLLLPFTIFIRKYYEMPIAQFIPYFIKHLFFGSTFKASWFLMASLLSIVLVSFLSKLFNNWLLLIIGLAFYGLACLSSNYYGLIQESSIWFSCRLWMTNNIGSPHNSFMAAILWVVIGKMLAEKHVWMSNVLLICLLLISLLFLWLEYYVLRSYGFVKRNDCYLMLIPSCILCFILIGQNDIRIPSRINAIKCRYFSTIIYCCHLTIVVVIQGLLSTYNVSLNNVFVFIMTLIFSVALGWLLLTIEEKYNVKILKYSH